MNFSSRERLRNLDKATVQARFQADQNDRSDNAFYSFLSLGSFTSSKLQDVYSVFERFEKSMWKSTLYILEA